MDTSAWFLVLEGCTSLQSSLIECGVHEPADSFPRLQNSLSLRCWEPCSSPHLYSSVWSMSFSLTAYNIAFSSVLDVLLGGPSVSFSSGFSCLGLIAHLHSVITSFPTESENWSIFIFSKTFSASSLAHSKGICMFWKSLHASQFHSVVSGSFWIFLKVPLQLYKQLLWVKTLICRAVRDLSDLWVAFMLCREHQGCNFHESSPMCGVLLVKRPPLSHPCWLEVWNRGRAPA